MSRIEQIITEIEEYIDSCKFQPLSNTKILVNKEELERTDNNLIFIDRESPVTMEDLDAKLSILSEATASLDDDGVREALRKVVPTFKRPEEVNNA